MQMQPSKVVKVVLINAGLTLLIIGLWILSSPQGFYAANAIELGNNINLFSEVRAPAGALLVFGLLLVVGAFIRALSFAAALSGSLLYLSYAAARALSVAVDGLPGEGLIVAGVVELLFGLACAYVLLKYHKV